MWEMKRLKTILCCYLVSCCILDVNCIATNAKNQIQIKEEERRAAEKLENKRNTLSSVIGDDSSESRKRGIFLSTIHRSPNTLIHPSVAVGYNSKDSKKSGYHYENRRPGYVEKRPNLHGYGGNKGGFPSYFVTGSYPAEFAGTYDHGSGNVYGHSGPGVYEQTTGGGYDYPPVYDHHTTNVDYQGGGESQTGLFKNPFGIKGILLPLAGIALLGAAAALTANPVLLQLGVVGGRRRRRGLIYYVNKDVYPMNHLVKPGKSEV